MLRGKDEDSISDISINLLLNNPVNAADILTLLSQDSLVVAVESELCLMMVLKRKEINSLIYKFGIGSKDLGAFFIVTSESGSRPPVLVQAFEKTDNRFWKYLISLRNHLNYLLGFVKSPLFSIFLLGIFIDASKNNHRALREFFTILQYCFEKNCMHANKG